MKAFAVEHFAALIGIDCTDTKHDICENPSYSNDYHYSVISSKPESIHQWATELAARYPNQKVAVACELQKGPLIYALSIYKHIIAFQLIPQVPPNTERYFPQVGLKMPQQMPLFK